MLSQFTATKIKGEGNLILSVLNSFSQSVPLLEPIKGVDLNIALFLNLTYFYSRAEGIIEQGTIIWDDIQSAYADASDVIEQVEKVNALLGYKFDSPFAQITGGTVCESGDNQPGRHLFCLFSFLVEFFYKGRLSLSVPVGCSPPPPFAGRIIRIDQGKQGTFVVWKREHGSPLRGKYLRMGPLDSSVDSSIYNYAHESFSRRWSGQIFENAPVCFSTGDLTLTLEVFDDEELTKLTDVDLVAMLQSPVHLNLPSLATLQTSVSKNLVFLEISGQVLINSRIIPQSVVDEFATPLSVQLSQRGKKNVVDDVKAAYDSASKFLKDVQNLQKEIFSFHARQILFTRTHRFFHLEFGFQLGPLPTVIVIDLMGFLQISAEVSMAPFKQAAQAALIPQAAAIVSAAVGVDLFIIRAGVGIIATIMDTTLEPRVRAFIDWPLDICFAVDLSIKPLRFERTEVFVCSYFSLQ